MRAIEPMLSNEYDADVEHKLQILTKQTTSHKLMQLV